jgi:hypothetical protein
MLLFLPINCESDSLGGDDLEVVKVEPPVISLLDRLKASTPSALGRKRAVSIN